VFNNFMAQIIGKLDIVLQAYAYLAVACIACVTTVIMLSRSGLVKNRYILLVMPLAIGLSGINHIFYYTTLTFQMYLLVITLFVILLREPERTLPMTILTMAVIAVLVWSGPYSVLAVPFAIGFLVLFRGKNLVMLWTILVTIAYVLTTTGKVGSGIVPDYLFSGKIQHLWFETILFDVLFMGFREGVLNVEKIALVALILGPTLYLIRHDTLHLRILLLLAIVIFATPAPLLLTNKYFLYRDVFPCHILTAQVAWVLFVLIVLDRLLERIKDSYREVAGITVMAAIALFVIADNIKHPSKGKTIILYNTREFLQTIKEYEGHDLKKTNENVVISADGLEIFDPVAKVGSRSKDAVTIKNIRIPQHKRP